MLGHQHLPLLLLLLNLLIPLLLQLLLQRLIIREGHGVQLLLLEQLGLLRVEMLHRVGVWTARRHASHHRGGIALGSRAGHAQVGEMLRNNPRLCARLTRVVCHAWSQSRMALRNDGMLLHARGMRRKGRHARHHSVLVSIIHSVDIDSASCALSHAILD